MHRLADFVRLSRPLFLGGPVVLFALGWALAGGDGAVAAYAIGQIAVTSTQLLAQYANEHFDADDDRLGRRTLLTGGSGWAETGLPPGTALAAARVVAAVAVIAGIASFWVSAWLPPVTAVAGAVSWWYSAPPLRLAASGWGELSAAVVVAGLVPVAGALARGAPDWPAVLAVASILVPAATAMLLTFNAVDAYGDAAAGKRTLWLRLGTRHAATLHLALVAVAVGAAFAAREALPDPAATLALVGLAPLAGSNAAIRRTPGVFAALLALGGFIAPATGMLAAATVL
jgi:1,4-dihydroxy-2-naphthoate octaprenyltransferase